MTDFSPPWRPPSAELSLHASQLPLAQILARLQATAPHLPLSRLNLGHNAAAISSLARGDDETHTGAGEAEDLPATGLSHILNLLPSTDATRFIRRLILSSCGLTASHLEHLGRYVEGSGTLTHLELQANDVVGDPSTLPSISSFAASISRAKLRHLDLSSNPLGSRGLVALLDDLRSPSLMELHLSMTLGSDNDEGGDRTETARHDRHERIRAAAQTIGRALQGRRRHRLLRDDDEGGGEDCDEDAPQLPLLQRLSLNGNSFGHKGVRSIVKAVLGTPEPVLDPVLSSSLIQAMAREGDEDGGMARRTLRSMEREANYGLIKVDLFASGMDGGETDDEEDIVAAADEEGGSGEARGRASRDDERHGARRRGRRPISVASFLRLKARERAKRVAGAESTEVTPGTLRTLGQLGGAAAAVEDGEERERRARRTRRGSVDRVRREEARDESREEILARLRGDVGSGAQSSSELPTTASSDHLDHRGGSDVSTTTTTTRGLSHLSREELTTLLASHIWHDVGRDNWRVLLRQHLTRNAVRRNRTARAACKVLAVGRIIGCRAREAVEGDSCDGERSGPLSSSSSSSSSSFRFADLPTELRVRILYEVDDEGCLSELQMANIVDFACDERSIGFGGSEWRGLGSKGGAKEEGGAGLLPCHPFFTSEGVEATSTSSRPSLSSSLLAPRHSPLRHLPFPPTSPSRYYVSLSHDAPKPSPNQPDLWDLGDGVVVTPGGSAGPMGGLASEIAREAGVGGAPSSSSSSANGDAGRGEGKRRKDRFAGVGNAGMQWSYLSSPKRIAFLESTGCERWRD